MVVLKRQAKSNLRLITKYFSDFLSLKTCNNEVAELGVRLIAECAL